MILNTKTLLEGESKIICEASFSYNGNFCSVDILKKIDDEIEIYEVKSSTKIEPIYIDDISYQSFVLKKCGLNIKRAFLVYINNKYVKKGSLELDKLFKIEDVTSKIDFNKTILFDSLLPELIYSISDLLAFYRTNLAPELSLDFTHSVNIVFCLPLLNAGEESLFCFLADRSVIRNTSQNKLQFFHWDIHRRIYHYTHYVLPLDCC